MYNFLLIEDSKKDSDVFLDTIKRMNSQVNCEQYKITVADSYAKGLEMISGDFNGVIVDIKLDDNHNGNEIINVIKKKHRLPVAIFTGTPDTEEYRNSPIIVYKKGEAKHENIIDDFCRVSDTGLFNVLSGTGIIESAMNKVFWQNLYPQIEFWKLKKEGGVDTEKVLLRYVISHIQELIDNEMPAHVTEEMYICPPVSSGIKTGSIIQDNVNNLYFIVLSPPCDLSIHDGQVKTDHVLLCEIEDQNEVNKKIIGDATSEKTQIKLIAKALNNNYTDYYHWLPDNLHFKGGYINFRRVTTYNPKDILDQFRLPLLKVQEGFVKSILGRFSAYYARQGQPDFDFETEASRIVKDCQEYYSIY